MAKGTINKAIIIGNIGTDITFTKKDDWIAASLSVATSEVWIDKKNGEKKDKTEWHRVICYGRVAEVCKEFLRKGDKVYVEGKLQTRKYNDAAGIEKYTTEIIANTVQIMFSRNKVEADDSPANNNYQKHSGEHSFTDDTIPF